VCSLSLFDGENRGEGCSDFYEIFPGLGRVGGGLDGALVEDCFPKAAILSRSEPIFFRGGIIRHLVNVECHSPMYSRGLSFLIGRVPRMLGLDGHPVHQSTDGWVPVYADGGEARLACMSVAFLLKKKDDSVIWRGPKKNAMIRQFLSDVRWGELDYLIIDTPPGELPPHPGRLS